MHVQQTKDIGIVRHTIITSILATKVAHSKDFGDIVIATDNKPYWRSEVFPHYKAGRKEQSEEDRLILSTIRNELRDVFPYKVIEVQGAEADDIIGVAALNAVEPTLIRANDGDFHQLLKNRLVKMYRPAVKEWVPDMMPHEIEWELFLKIAKGDKGDGVPNCINPNDVFVNGVKQKTLRENTVRDWYEHGIPDNVRSRFFENKKLIDLSEIPVEMVDRIKTELSKPRGPNGGRSQIYKFLLANGLNKLSDKIGLF